MTEIKVPKKLIEVALPLDDINVAAGKEKSIRQGHPSTLHLWWARRPLAAARAVLFAQMVNDPGYQRDIGFGVNKLDAEKKREKLFSIIRDLVKWENSNNEEVIGRAKSAIWDSWRETCSLNKDHPEAEVLFNPEKLPATHDPFAGGGSIPLESLRLGLETYASDLNPVPVILNKAMLELPMNVHGLPPVGPMEYSPTKQYSFSEHDSPYAGLVEDVNRYGGLIRANVLNKIEKLYPKITISNEIIEENPSLKDYLGQEFRPITWLWARTVKSPNPAYSHVDVPLCSTFVLSGKKGKERYLKPIISGDSYDFEVCAGELSSDIKSGTKASRGGNFKCIFSGSPIPVTEIRQQGKEGGLGKKLLAAVISTPSGRVFISPKFVKLIPDEDIAIGWSPNTDINHNPRDIRTQLYGLTKYQDLFTKRQLAFFDKTISELHELADQIESDFVRANPELSYKAKEYRKAIVTYLAIAVSRTTNTLNSLAVWSQGREQSVNLFSRQAIPMTWDFPEVNPFGGAAGDLIQTLKSMSKSILALPKPGKGVVVQLDAQSQSLSSNKVISTDPPYYDNIAYADLSDFFYVWLRKLLKHEFSEEFSTLTVPKQDELVASQYRHGSNHNAEKFFLEGMTKAMHNLAENAHPSFPVTIYYAFKQSETKGNETSNSGWCTFLQAVINSGFSIEGTWPMRTERPTGVKVSMNALASSIILVCRVRKKQLGSISRRQFQRELKADMPEALEAMIGGESGQSPIAPVDLAQAAIGPGMAIYSKYDAVLNQDGSEMSVHDALVMINKEITDYLNPDAGVYDVDTLFCSDWFDQYGWSQGEFGIADTLARAKGTSVEGVEESGVIEAGVGKVRLLRWEDMDSNWDPKIDNRVPVWEACHQIIRELNQKGESAAGVLLARMPEHGEAIRQLAYHMYTLCERKKWAEDARAYNELITAWHSVVEASLETGHKNEQMGFDL